jgi:hypothetical protein
MLFCVILRSVVLVRTKVLEERSLSVMRVTRIGELGTTLAVNSKPTHAAKKYAGEQSVFTIGLSGKPCLRIFGNP